MGNRQSRCKAAHLFCSGKTQHLPDLCLRRTGEGDAGDGGGSGGDSLRKESIIFILNIFTEAVWSVLDGVFYSAPVRSCDSQTTGQLVQQEKSSLVFKDHFHFQQADGK